MIGSIVCFLVVSKINIIRLNIPYNLIIVGLYTLLQGSSIANMVVTLSSYKINPDIISMVIKNAGYSILILVLTILLSFIPSKIIDLTSNPFGFSLQYILEILTVILFLDVLPWNSNLPYLKSVSESCTLILFTIYLIYDSQLVIGGKYKQRHYKTD